MDVLELLGKGKNAIRSNQKLSDLFSEYYKEHFNGAIASFCCTFKDFDKLHNLLFTKSKNMELKKYKVDLKPNEILYFVKDKKVHRSFVRRLTDEFLDGFVEYHDPKVFFKEIKKIEILGTIDEPINLDGLVGEALSIAVNNLTAKQAIEVIESADFDLLVLFEGDKRKTVASAFDKRNLELIELEEDTEGEGELNLDLDLTEDA